jgi:DivIVA domain-containing protein
VTLFFLLLTLAVFGVTAALIAGLWDDRMPEPVSTVPPVSLPEEELSVEGLGRLRFAPALRGYRMDQVDAVLDRVGEELSVRDARIHALTEELNALRQGEPALTVEDDPAGERQQ